VINVTSGAHRNTPILLENLNLDGIYTPRLGYGHSKTANVLMANEIERRYGSKGVHGMSVHPGCIRTGMQRNATEEQLRQRLEENAILKKVLKSTEQGAATQVWAAVGKVWEGKGGLYLEECRVGHQSESPDLENGGYKSYLLDEEAASKLWEASLQMVGL
jgi:NAD(P)-dependent dehydrogenase (short-subunit alcohol dehydrogenase family)